MNGTTAIFDGKAIKMTTLDTSRPAHDFSSSNPTAVSARCEAMLELGRKLTKELDLDCSVNTLGRWMAHYIAELIMNAEKANNDERPAKMQACSEAILGLWKHRYELPNGKRPFEKLEPMLRTLESLDPDDDRPRYFRSARAAAEKSDEEGETKFWLELVDGLDDTARMLIRYNLTQAAQSALDKSAEWVTLAEAAGAYDGIESPVVRLILGENNLLKASDPDTTARNQLEDRVKRLEGFTKTAITLTSELRKQLSQLKV